MNRRDGHRRAATYVDKILKGAEPTFESAARFRRIDNGFDSRSLVSIASHPAAKAIFGNP